MVGRIIRIVSNDYTVKCNDKLYVCKARGVFRNQNITPLAGDLCNVDLEKSVIDKILPRKNELNRPPVSNIDIAIVVISTIKPDFSMNLLDKMINIIRRRIRPIVLSTGCFFFGGSSEG